MHLPDLPPELLVGVASIDNEHQGLVVLLDRLIGMPQTQEGSEQFSEALSNLCSRLSDHFKSEEYFFQSCGMPDEVVVAHLNAHNSIIEQYVELSLDVMKKGVQPLPDVAQMVKGWIVDHLLEHDLKIRQYVTA